MTHLYSGKNVGSSWHSEPGEMACRQISLIKAGDLGRITCPVWASISHWCDKAGDSLTSLLPLGTNSFLIKLSLERGMDLQSPCGQYDAESRRWNVSFQRECPVGTPVCPADTARKETDRDRALPLGGCDGWRPTLSACGSSRQVSWPRGLWLDDGNEIIKKHRKDDAAVPLPHTAAHMS